MIRPLGVLAAVLVAAGCAAAGCASSPDEALPQATVPASSPDQPSPSTTAAPAHHAPSGSGGASPGLVNDNGTLESPLSDFQAEVTGTSWASSLTDSLHGTTKPDGRYLLVRVLMRNISQRPVYPPAHLSLFTADGTEYVPQWDQTFGQTVLVGHGKVNDLSPGARTTVVLVYDVPAGTKPRSVADLKI
ncbi:DUF4352 domain-containing protein [Actinomadura rupiterrae]|uniref:DUF4352 domain-containing protein n=1 Tax=Actinomadura rupiterrae TaxID=559627 RepID=UPI0020A34F77|nr:DUF4352 domain-containing protein [Actinomadura rupiterrae]MCP2342557.1 hypothetical protein [Actinomadura rupiterrae]